MAGQRKRTLFGAELKRLRGARSVADIAALSARPGLSHRIKPIDEVTLRALEDGKKKADINALHTLSVVYRVSMQELLDLLTQERLIARAGELPDTLDELRPLRDEALAAGQWFEALAVAAKGEEVAPTVEAQMDWRLDRAAAMEKVGLGRSALLMLHDMADSPKVAAAHRYHVFRILANMLAASGSLTMAADAARRAVELAPDDIEPKWRSALLHAQVRIVLLRAFTHDQVGDEEMRASLGVLEHARSFVTPDDTRTWLTLDLMEALGTHVLGDHAAAIGELARVAQEARQNGHRYIEMLALKDLGSLLREDERLEEAREALTDAEVLAIEDGCVDEAFDIYFELYRVSEGLADGREQHYLEQCEEYYPLVHARTPNIRAYEQLLRAGQ